MSTATLPPPPGATTFDPAPVPPACLNCDGGRVEPDEDQITCLRCDGTGIEGAAKFRLPASRAHAVREVDYRPECCRRGAASGVLKVRMATKESHKRSHYAYQVHEIPCDGANRGFAVAKVGHPDRLHHVEAGPDGVRCDCEGETFQTTAKHNQKAHESGQEVFPGYGCRHSDAVVALLVKGWFDE